MEQHEVNANWKSDMYFEADAPGGLIKMDAAEEMGGKGKGNRAKPLMLTAIAGCTGMDVASLMHKMRVDIGGLKIEVTGELTDEHPKVYKKVHITYKFSGQDADREKFEKAVDLSFEKYCGVIAMFKSFAQVTKEIQFN